MRIVTFHQITDALEFEDRALIEDKKFRLIPVPRKISSSCGLSGRTNLDYKRVAGILDELQLETDGVYEEEDGDYKKLE